MEPCTPSTLFGYFDILLLSVIILFNFLIWRYDIIKVINWKVISLRFVFLFLIFPLLSTKVELSNVYRKFDDVEGFNLLYIWLRFPTWWVIGLIEIVVTNLIINKKQKSPLSENRV